MNYFVWAAGAAAAWPQSPGLPHESFKGCCLGWWLVIGQLCKHHVTRVRTRAMSEAFIHITYVSSMSTVTLHTKHNPSDDTWTLNRSDLYFAPGLSSCAGCCEASCEAAEPEVRPGRERGSGMLLMQTEFIYQLSIALISLKTKTLLPTNLQANKFCISCAGEKNWTNKNSQTIHHRNCLQDLFSRFSDAGRWSALWLRLRPVVSWRLVICFRVKVL